MSISQTTFGFKNSVMSKEFKGFEISGKKGFEIGSEIEIGSELRIGSGLERILGLEIDPYSKFEFGFEIGSGLEDLRVEKSHRLGRLEMFLHGSKGFGRERL